MKFWMDGPDQQGSHRYPAWQPCLQNAGSGRISDVARDRFCNVRLCCKVPNLGGRLYESRDGQGCKQLGDLKIWEPLETTGRMFIPQHHYEEKTLESTFRAQCIASYAETTNCVGSNPSVPFRGKRINRININKRTDFGPRQDIILFQSLCNIVHLLCSIRVQCGAKTGRFVAVC